MNDLPAPKMPALFVGHGSPMNAIEDNDFTRRWQALGERRKPAAARSHPLRFRPLVHARHAGKHGAKAAHGL